MAVGACHDRSAAGRGDRVRAEAVVEHAPLGRQAADILILRILAQDSSVYAPCLRRVVVGEDEKEFDITK